MWHMACAVAVINQLLSLVSKCVLNLCVEAGGGGGLKMYMTLRKYRDGCNFMVQYLP